MFGFSSQEKAYIGPFLVFLGLLAFGGLIGKLGEGYAYWPVAAPMYWIFPLQTVVCGALLARNWHFYELRPPAKPILTIAAGIVVLAIWVAPQTLGIAKPRLEGFEPGYFGPGFPYGLNLAFRFLRLVIIVPLVEEIFWRGFLLRYVINQDFTRVPFGTFEWKSFAVVTAGFCLEHQMADWPAAILAGAIYNWVAYSTRSLSACVLAHAVTNLLLGIFVLRTGQWGFW